MKLEKKFNKYDEYQAYSLYESLVYNVKDFGKVNKKEMLKEIIDVYKIDGYLYSICTLRELELLRYLRKNDLTKTDRKKYDWEINELSNKLIINKSKCEIYEEQVDNVINALKTKINKQMKNQKDFYVFIVGVVRTNGTMLVKSLKNLVVNVFNVDENLLGEEFNNPFIHYYCCCYQEFKSEDENWNEYICYRNYYDYIDEINENRKKYALSGTFHSSVEENEEMFYYGYHLSNEKVRKLFDEVKKHRMKSMLLKEIERYRVLGSHSGLAYFIDKEMLSKIEDALSIEPSPSYCGFSKKELEEEKKKRENLKIIFSRVMQNDAHLPRRGADQFYKLYLSLIDYVNQKYEINLDVGKIEKQEETNPELIKDIDDYLWKHKNVIDEYIKDNPLNLKQDELDIVANFKSALTSDEFILVGFDRDYTRILSNDGMIYMVKGIRDNIDKMIKNREIPVHIKTTLLMFKGRIIHNSFMYYRDIDYSSDLRNEIAFLCDKAKECYEL